MGKITQWEHFKLNRYLHLSVFFILFSVLVFIEIEREVKWIAGVLFLIGAVVIPVANYLSWKGKLQ